jgi:hypothetical protein
MGAARDPAERAEIIAEIHECIDDYTAAPHVAGKLLA